MNLTKFLLSSHLYEGAFWLSSVRIVLGEGKERYAAQPGGLGVGAELPDQRLNRDIQYQSLLATDLYGLGMY
jgi:hypothetical protein